MMLIWLLLVYLDIGLELHMSQGVGLGSDFRLLRRGISSSLLLKLKSFVYVQLNFWGKYSNDFPYPRYRTLSPFCRIFSNTMFSFQVCISLLQRCWFLLAF